MFILVKPKQRKAEILHAGVDEECDDLIRCANIRGGVVWFMRGDGIGHGGKHSRCRKWVLSHDE